MVDRNLKIPLIDKSNAPNNKFGEVPSQAKKNMRHYAFMDYIGKGEFGMVWRAIDMRDNKEVAVKEIRK